MSDPSPLIRLSGIRFGYAGAARPVLDGLDLTLHAGERVAVAGPNGAGKSTLLQIVVGLLVPAAGTLEAFGAERREEKDFREVRRRAGLVFQDPDDQLFCPTVREDVAFGPLNLGLGKRAAAERATETLESLGLHGYEERITHHLSGGEKRLVALATVLAMRPRVLLLDEPTNALDAEATERLLAILENLGQAMMIVSHDRDTRLRLATRSLVLQQGMLVPGEA